MGDESEVAEEALELGGGDGGAGEGCEEDEDINEDEDGQDQTVLEGGGAEERHAQTAPPQPAEVRVIQPTHSLSLLTTSRRHSTHASKRFPHSITTRVNN